MIAKNITDLIGHTPLMELSNYGNSRHLEARLLAKLECFNPAGSVKDRIGRSMIEDAEKRGVLKPGSVIIEPTSGNAGIGLAAVAASKGYRVILTMPDTMSVERRNLLKAYGAEVVLTEGKKGMQGAIDRAKELLGETPDAFMPGQFVNPANPRAHFETTGPEIWEDAEGKVDIFVAGIGTGGTISGVARFLKGKNPKIKVVGVEPAGSAVLSGEQPGPHRLQGLGAGFVPETLDRSVIDEIMPVGGDEAYESGREIARKEGILVGISSGAAVWAAEQLAKRPENKGAVIVALLPDTGERYLSTPFYLD